MRNYSKYRNYTAYLAFMCKLIASLQRVLKQGKFLVINVAPIIVPRLSRNQESKRIPLPFDIHQICMQAGFDFIDDIIWQKPEGAGWATQRGRRFSADRNPMQYKPVPVTEYILVYRKKSNKLIDYFIRNQSFNVLKESKIIGDYEHTNVWYIKPTHSKLHPAVFPMAMAQNVIKYYSFVGDLVLDPLAGIGTVGNVCRALRRKFILFDYTISYVLNSGLCYDLELQEYI
jgi:DNA modification methylase